MAQEKKDINVYVKQRWNHKLVVSLVDVCSSIRASEFNFFTWFSVQGFDVGIKDWHGLDFGSADSQDFARLMTCGL